MSDCVAKGMWSLLERPVMKPVPNESTYCQIQYTNITTTTKYEKNKSIFLLLLKPLEKHLFICYEHQAILKTRKSGSNLLSLKTFDANLS